MNEFLRASDASGPLVFDVEGEDPSQVHRQVFDQPFALIGRDRRSDLTLLDGQVSLRHVYVQLVAGRVYCVDLGSRTGIDWDGERRPYGWLERGRAIGVGRFRIRLQSGDRDASGLGASLSDAADLLNVDSQDSSLSPKLTLEVDDGATRLAWRMKRTLVLVGSRDFCKLRMVDPSISSIHCSLIRTASGPWIVDLLGRGGVRINGSSVRHAHLQHGDEIQLGRFTLRVRSRPAGDAREPDTAAGRALSVMPAPTLAPAWPASRPVSPANSELMPYAAALPPGQSEMMESFVLPLLNQFGMMQQQMFDQLQQMMLMMVQSFGSLHREQAELIRNELNRLNQLTQEIQTLKTEMAQRLPANGVVTAPLSTADTLDPAAPRERRTSAMGTASPPPASTVPPRPLVAPGEAKDYSAEEENFLLTLHQRLATIQQERESHWEKLLKLVPGLRREGLTP